MFNFRLFFHQLKLLSGYKITVMSVPFSIRLNIDSKSLQAKIYMPETKWAT